MIGEHKHGRTRLYNPRQLRPSDRKAEMSSDAHGERREAVAEVPDEGVTTSEEVG